MMEETWEAEGTIAIQLLGTVAAGQPLEVFTLEETLEIPESLWKGRKIFALKVRGSSMIEAGIQDGDYLIVEPRADAENGRTVVAEVDGRVTVKKLYRDPRGQIRLQPANAEMLPLITSGERVKLVGVVVGVLRKYGFGQDRHPARTGPRSLAPARRAATSSMPADDATLDLALNAIDTQLDRWKAAMDTTTGGRPTRRLATMAELGRDLQALRDWCARTSKPGLRRALLTEANQIILRMQRLLGQQRLPPNGETLH